MSQLDFNFWQYGSTTTSTGNIVLKSGPTVLHAININSSGTGTIEFYNATSSGTAALVASVNAGTIVSHLYDIVLPTCLMRGQTTSTADITVSFA